MMCKFTLLTTVSLVLVCAASSLSRDDTCTNQPASQSQLGMNLLQARHESTGTIYVTEKHRLSINPSGAAAPLSEAGYAAVADRCCQVEMKEFIRRQILELDMEICDEAGLNGIVPYHSCEKGPQTFDILTSNLLADVAHRDCPWLASTGNCKPKDPRCPNFPKVEIADCGCSLSKAVVLDFQGANVVHNNLGGKGPDTGVAELRYANIGEYPAGQGLDLVMTTDDIYEGTPSFNGKSPRSPQFAQIALKAMGNPAGFSGEINLQLGFVRASTNTPVVLPAFFFAVFDIDTGNDGGIVQTVTGTFYNGYVTDVSTDLVASTADGGTKLTGTQLAVAIPTDPMSVTPEQRRSSVMFFYENLASFELSLGVERSLASFEPGTAWEKLFHFAGSSALSDMCSA